MNLELEQPDSNIYVNHYSKGEIVIAKKKYQHNIVFTPEDIISDNWILEDLKLYTEDDFKLLIDLPSEIFLLGTGENIIIPSAEIIYKFQSKGKSIDFMGSSAACRTFNILAQEARNVCAAIII